MQTRADTFRDFLKAFEELDPEARKEAIALAEEECSGMRFVPNPGPQTDAYYSLADELYYGGAGGGGKTRLLCGLPVNEHFDIHLFRREGTQLRGLVKELTKIIGTTDGFNSQLNIWRLPNGQTIELAGVKDEADKEKWQGREADYKGFDEICHFTRSQYRFIIGWNRSTRPGQRCRVVATGNPPMTAEGLWVIQHWAAWLDPKHPDPAAAGELRWPVRANDDDEDLEIFFRTSEDAMRHLATLRTAPRDYDGNIIPPRSRSFIPAKLEDNPDLMRAGYSAVIESMPKDVREALQGSFAATLRDAEFQVIPTAWIMAAQARWKPDGFKDFAMTVMAFDPAGGGRDAAELCWRHGGWYAEFVSEKGESTAESTTGVSNIFKHRRDGAPVVLDVGGGYAGKIKQRLDDNNTPTISFNGANSSAGRALGSKLKFANKRAEAWWRFREALDPEQDGGSAIALPPDPEMRADLAAPCLVPRALERGLIQIESKEELRKRLGRSPGKGDVVVMAWAEGRTALRRKLSSTSQHERPKFANVGYANMKRRRR